MSHELNTSEQSSVSFLSTTPKRYSTEERRSFHRSDTYTEGRRTLNSRDTRAMAKRPSTVAPSRKVSGRGRNGTRSSDSGPRGQNIGWLLELTAPRIRPLIARQLDDSHGLAGCGAVATRWPQITPVDRWVAFISS